MKTILIDALLISVVAAGWLGAAGFARLRTPLDRIHCVTLVNTVCGLSLASTAFVSDGVSGRAIKIFFIVALNLLTGAVISHATARALIQRDKNQRGKGP